MVTCPVQSSCTASLCVCVLGLECTEEWVGVSDPDLRNQAFQEEEGAREQWWECEPRSVDLT